MFLSRLWPRLKDKLVYESGSRVTVGVRIRRQGHVKGQV